MFRCFAEAETQIQDNVLYSQFPQTFQAYGKIVADFKEDIVIMRILLHFVRLCRGVHEDIRDLQFGYGFKECFIETSAGYIVDYVRPFLYACFADFAPNGVDRERNLRIVRLGVADYRQKTFDFLLWRYQFGSGAGGTGTKVYYIRILRYHRVNSLLRTVKRVVSSTIIKRVIGKVNYSHYQGSGEIDDFFAAKQRFVSGNVCNFVVFFHSSDFQQAKVIIFMNNTSSEYDNVVKISRKLFEDKLSDYGASWRVLRLPSLTDQIFIKANRIRSIQESGVNLVDEGIFSEFIGMINYGIIALIQIELKDEPVDKELTKARALELYDKYIGITKSLMEKKNHDYSEAWRQMRVSSITDLILMKIYRLKQIEDNQGRTLVSEGVEAGYEDIVNYSVFACIKLS